MDIEEIKTLTDLMVSNDLSEIMIRDGEKRIVIRRGSAGHAGHMSAPVHAHMHSGGAMHAMPTQPQAPVAPPVSEVSTLPRITSPMVGTYYAAPDPESPPFVKIGDRVGPETVVCIIEAMKVFNEIKAELSGTIESIEVSSGTPVEFGQVLMRVRA
jgi:acetyl-CoA carboxylase biotin carboxyl carrier protein